MKNRKCMQCNYEGKMRIWTCCQYFTLLTIILVVLGAVLIFFTVTEVSISFGVKISILVVIAELYFIYWGLKYQCPSCKAVGKTVEISEEDIKAKSVLSKKTKIIWILYFIFLIVSIIAWLFSGNFLINHAYFIYDWPFKLAIFLIVIAVFHLLLNKKKFVEKKQNIISVFFGYIIIIPIMVFLHFTIALPSIMHYILNTPSELQVAVYEKIQKKRCKNGIRVKGLSSQYRGRLCKLDDASWNNILNEDIYLLNGTYSIFGFRYDREQVEKLTKPRSQ